MLLKGIVGWDMKNINAMKFGSQKIPKKMWFFPSTTKSQFTNFPA